jgi:hypothetical protein
MQRVSPGSFQSRISNAANMVSTTIRESGRSNRPRISSDTSRAVAINCPPTVIGQKVGDFRQGGNAKWIGFLAGSFVFSRFIQKRLQRSGTGCRDGPMSVELPPPGAPRLTRSFLKRYEERSPHLTRASRPVNTF